MLVLSHQAVSAGQVTVKSSAIVTKSFLLAIYAMLLSGCNTESQEGPQSARIECTDPRPEMCTQHYDPVCATRDSGVRCVTTPCDSTETATYPNGCMACADPDVISYVEGLCPQ